MQRRVLDRHRGETRDAHQDFKVFRLESRSLVRRVNLQHADHVFLAVEHGDAHHRADAEVRDALAHFKTTVGRGVGRQHRFLRGANLIDDRVAKPERLVGGPSLLHRPHAQRVAAAIPQRDESAVGLQEHLKQTIEHAGQHFVERQRLAQAARDLDQRLELDLRLDRESQPGTGRGEVDFAEDGRRVVVLGGEQRPDPQRLAVDRVVPHEAKQRFADAKLVAVAQAASSPRQAAVDVGAVSALQVFDIEGPLRALDQGVASTDRAQIEHDVAIRVAT